MPPQAPFRCSDQTTQGIRVGAAAFYLSGQSEPEARHFTFGYRIMIENTGGRAATLRTRHWDIVDALGRHEVVEGPGVVGEEPRLLPGQGFTYQSFAVLRTQWGTMEGRYTFERDDGEAFEVPIGRFYLVPEQSVPTA